MPASARRLLALLTTLCAALALAVPAAHAAPTETVTTLAASGPGSLENAVNSVDDGGTVTFAPGLTGTITLSSPLFLFRAVTIVGPGAQRLALSGDDAATLVYVDSAADVELSGLTLRNGRAVGATGGAVHKRGAGRLTIRDSRVVDNMALASGGLAAYGGGIFVAEGGLTLEGVALARNSAIAANGASFAGGGGLELGEDAGPALLRNVTVSGNEVAGPTSAGGGISDRSQGASGSVVLEHVTIAGNRATGGSGGGLFASPATLLRDSVIADNSAVTGPDCALVGAPGLAVGGRNIVEDPADCGLGPEVWPVDPELGPLQLNGPGETETMALGAGSPAIDTVLTADCPPPATDQRGVPRPQGNGCDLGAFEARPAALAAPIPLAIGFIPRDAGAGPSTPYTITVGNTVDADFDLTLGAIRLTGPQADAYVLDASDCPATLEPGESCDVALSFDPATGGEKSATVAIATSVGDFETELSGFARYPTMTVTNLDDVGEGTLRTALLEVASGGRVEFADGLAGTIRLGPDQLQIGRAVTVVGPGPDKLTIDGGGRRRILAVAGTGDVELSGLTLTGGRAGYLTNRGGAVLKQGTGALTIRDSRIVDNVAESNAMADDVSGAGIYALGGDLTLERVTIAGNRAQALSGGSSAIGGGLAVGSDVGTTTLRNVTIAGNSAESAPDSATPGSGGGLWIDNASTGAPVVLEHVTVAGNSAATGGGLTTGVAPRLVGSLLADNSGGDCATTGAGTVEARGVNLIESTAGCVVSGAGAGAVISGEDPRLAPLALAAPGETETMALTAGSPALDAAPVSGDGACPPPATDQRGVERPQGAACDLGAYEARPAVASLAPAAHDFGARLVGSGASAPAQLTLSNAADADLPVETAAIALGGAGADQFALTAGSCAATLAPGTSCALEATFAPTRAGAAEATVGGAGASATLRGTGTTPDPGPPAPPAPTPPTPDPPAPPVPTPAVVKPAAIERFTLAQRCVRPGRGGRVAVGMNLRLSRAARVRVEFARAIGTRGLARCPRRGSPGTFDGSFAPAGTFTPGATATVQAASVARRYTITARLRPALYRVTVRPYTGARKLGRPVRRYLRVLAP